MLSVLYSMVRAGRQVSWARSALTDPSLDRTRMKYIYIFFSNMVGYPGLVAKLVPPGPDNSSEIIRNG